MIGQGRFDDAHRICAKRKGENRIKSGGNPHLSGEACHVNQIDQCPKVSDFREYLQIISFLVSQALIDFFKLHLEEIDHLGRHQPVNPYLLNSQRFAAIQDPFRGNGAQAGEDELILGVGIDHPEAPFQGVIEVIMT